MSSQTTTANPFVQARLVTLLPPSTRPTPSTPAVGRFGFIREFLASSVGAVDSAGVAVLPSKHTTGGRMLACRVLGGAAIGDIVTRERPILIAPQAMACLDIPAFEENLKLTLAAVPERDLAMFNGLQGRARYPSALVDRSLSKTITMRIDTDQGLGTILFVCVGKAAKVTSEGQSTMHNAILHILTRVTHGCAN